MKRRRPGRWLVCIELLLVAPKNPLLTKTLIEFTLWAEENNWDYETLCEKFCF